MPRRRAVAFLASITTVFVLAFPLPSHAGFPTSTWRCGTRAVGIGQTVDDVYERCGEPTTRTATTEFVTVRVSHDVSVTHAVPVETWTYDRGSNHFVRFLTFRDGILVDIDEGSYGF